MLQQKQLWFPLISFSKLVSHSCGGPGGQKQTVSVAPTAAFIKHQGPVQVARSAVLPHQTVRSRLSATPGSTCDVSWSPPAKYYAQTLNQWRAEEERKKVVLCEFKIRSKTKQVNWWSTESDSNEALLPTARPGAGDPGLSPDCSAFLWSCLLFPPLGPSLLVLITSPPNGTDER